jgi:hypothetical protein
MVQVGYRQQRGIDGAPSSWIDRFRSRVQATNPLVEMVVAYSVVFGIGWTWIPAAYVANSMFWYLAGWSVLGFLFIWMIFISHAARKRSFEDLGFSSHRSFKAKLDKVLKWGEKWNYMLIYGTIIAAYAIFMLNFLPFTDLLPFIGELNEFVVENVSNSAFTFILATGQFALFSVGTALFFFKTDNIKQSVKEYAKYGTPFILFLFTWALLTSEYSYTETFMNVVSRFLGYIYWALAQQLTTLVYVNTSAMEGLERSGLVKDPQKRRIISSLITASVFAGIHIPAMPLSLIAFVMEFIIAMIFSFKQYRNAFAACLFHAMVGVIIVLLMRIDVVVGFLAFLG